VKQGSAAIHIVNWNYEASGDRFAPVRNLKLTVDLTALGVRGQKQQPCIGPVKGRGNPPGERNRNGRAAGNPTLGCAGSETGISKVMKIRNVMHTCCVMHFFIVSCRMKSTLTDKGQTTIPRHVRKALGIRPRQRLHWTVNADGTASVTPEPSAMDCFATLKPKVPFRGLKHEKNAVRRGIAQVIARRTAQ
jgi:bifunctional DNA-binding transcriptional regulator/antitoxin component of YhaV-PrlF toxin-antitoxin module